MRNTVQRQLILNAVKELNIHATAEQVIEYLADKYPSIGRATVYRNLSLMAESGELLNIGNFYGAAHYDHNCHEHYHFICEECKRVVDVDGDFSQIYEKINNMNLKIRKCNISFSGLCGSCQDAQNA